MRWPPSAPLQRLFESGSLHCRRRRCRRLVQPSTRLVPDYHTWVPKASTMILPDILKKARGGRYLSLEQFRYGGGGGGGAVESRRAAASPAQLPLPAEEAGRRW